jgi:hypothetical protein
VRETLLDGLLEWLAGSGSWFDPPQEDEVFDVAPEEIVAGRSRKAFVELGLALRLAMRSPALREHPALCQMRDAWVAKVYEREVFFDVRRRPNLLPLRVVAYGTLRSFGHDVDGVAASLQRVLDRGFVDRRERSAWEKFDLKYHFDDLGLRHALPAATALVAQSTLPSPAPLPHATRFDLYAFTHLVFDVTDFGGRRPDRIGSDWGGAARDYSAAALAMCMSMQDWDLTGELVAARTCAGFGWEPIDDAAVLALCHSQHSTGCIPGREWTAEKLAAGSGDPVGADLFFDVYHPTLVALIMIACAGADG